MRYKKKNMGATMLKNRLREIRMIEYQEDPREFAARIKVSVAAYYQYEDQSSRPKLEKAFEIAKILEKNLEEIWYLEDN